MTMVALPLAFVPALGFLALRSFLKAHPSATSEGDIQSLQPDCRVFLSFGQQLLQL
jgi:hypothetical protein